MSQLLDQAHALAPEVVGALAGACVIIGALATTVQLGVRRRKAELRRVAHEIVDERTGLLPRTAIPVRLGAELGWGGAAGVPVSVVVLRIRGAGFVQAAGVLRSTMRDEEQAYLLADDKVVVELWDAGPNEAWLGVQRIGYALGAAGFDVVDAGVACCPRDGDDADELVMAAASQLRPIDDQLPASDESTGIHGTARRSLVVLAGVMPWFAAMGLLLLSCWRLLPAIFEPRLDTLSGAQFVAPLGGIAVLSAASALLWATCWNLGGGTLPRSRPIGPATWRSMVVVGAVLAGLLTLAALELSAFAGSTASLGVVLAVILLLVLAMTQARQLVHAPGALLVLLLAAGAGIVFAAVEQFDLPVVANAGRMLGAAALGALLARATERPSWLVALSVLVAGVDIWSVFSDDGVSRQLLESRSESASRLIDLLLFHGPHVHGAPLFALGTTDLVFLGFYLAWAHDWRMDVRVVAAVLTMSVSAAFVWSTALESSGSDSTVPVLPLLALGMVVLVGIRWGRLALQRGRTRRSEALPVSAPG